MKLFLPYNILLILAVLAMGLMVSYNLALRQSFGITVGYDLPQPQPEPASGGEEMADGPQKLYTDEEPPSVSQEDEDGGWNEPDTVVVLASFPLDVNAATVEQLTYIPRIGEVTAQRIVQYRALLGGYTQLEQLKEIKGIGDATFDVIAPYLYVQGEWKGVDEEETG